MGVEVSHLHVSHFYQGLGIAQKKFRHDDQKECVLGREIKICSPVYQEEGYKNW